MKNQKPDFEGWATVADLLCSDGRMIDSRAFAHQDGMRVPLVWNHNHTTPTAVIGEALLEHRDGGEYVYCFLQDDEYGRKAKRLVDGGIINQLSILANRLVENGPRVMHGDIKEVSLVIAGANPGACIKNTVQHGEILDEAMICTGKDFVLRHSDVDQSAEENSADKSDGENADSQDSELQHGDQTVADILSTLSDRQMDAVAAVVADLIESDQQTNNQEEDDNMKNNVFDSQNSDTENKTLSHSDLNVMVTDIKRYGSLKESVLQHSEDYGITDIDTLFPDPKALSKEPEFIKRDTGWVSDVMGSVHKSPFSRVKCVFADITAEEARAKGYIKGAKKKDEVFGLLKRVTTPTTIYKKQRLDRDDLVDIDWDVVPWLKKEMRGMLDEEIARAVLITDGRLAGSDDKISEDCIRPIWKDSDLYTIKARMDVDSTASDDLVAKAFIRSVIKSRKDYKGSGNPTLYTTEDMITNCLLLEDNNGRIIYDSEEKLRTALRVKKIVTVPVMEGQSRKTDGGETLNLCGIVVNLADYTLGADKGGNVSMFDDFDIDYNQMKYLIETRCSGAMTKPYAAIAIERSVVSE